MIIILFILIILSNKLLLNKLKKDYFNVNQSTDVIAFNLEDEKAPIDGEIYISIDDVLHNAVENTILVTISDKIKVETLKKIYNILLDEEIKTLDKEDKDAK